MSVPGSQPPYVDTNGPHSYPSSLASSFSSDSSLFSSLASLSAVSSLASSTSSLQFPASKNARTPVAAPTKSDLSISVPQYRPYSYYSHPDPQFLPPHPEPEQAKKTPRPPNSFILYRKEQAARYTNLTAAELSKILGERWSRESPERKAHYANLAKIAEQEHHLKYPEYKFTPAKRGTGKKARALRAAANTALKTAAVVAAASLAFDRDVGPSPLRSSRASSRRPSVSSMSSMSSPPPTAVSPSVYDYSFSTTDNNALSPPNSRLLWQPSPLSPPTTSSVIETHSLSELRKLQSPPLSRRPVPAVPQYNFASSTPCSPPPVASASSALLQNHATPAPQMLMAKVSSQFPPAAMPHTASSLFFDPFVSAQWQCPSTDMHADPRRPSYDTSLAPEGHYSHDYPHAPMSASDITQDLRHSCLEDAMDESTLNGKLSQLLREEIVHMTMHDQNPALARFYNGQDGIPPYIADPSQALPDFVSPNFVQDVATHGHSILYAAPARVPFSFNTPAPPHPPRMASELEVQFPFQARPKQPLATPSRPPAPLISTLNGIYPMPETAPPTPISPITFNPLPMPSYMI